MVDQFIRVAKLQMCVLTTVVIAVSNGLAIALAGPYLRFKCGSLKGIYIRPLSMGVRSESKQTDNLRKSRGDF